jgi:hypothetical protein
VTPPVLETADLIRTAGAAFVRQWTACTSALFHFSCVRIKQFVDAAEFKADLAKLDAHYSAFPEGGQGHRLSWLRHRRTCSSGRAARMTQLKKLLASRRITRRPAGAGLIGLGPSRSSATMEHEISFAPCYDLYHEMGARPGFSFVDLIGINPNDGTGTGSRFCDRRHAQIRDFQRGRAGI